MAHGRSWIDAAEALTRAVNRVFALAASLLVAVIVAVVVREVVLRYGFNTPSTWALDAARYLLLFTFFLALAPALESGHHVHVDLFDPLFPPAWRRWLHLSGLGAGRILRRGAVLVCARRNNRRVRDRRVQLLGHPGQAQIPLLDRPDRNVPIPSDRLRAACPRLVGPGGGSPQRSRQRVATASDAHAVVSRIPRLHPRAHGADGD